MKGDENVVDVLRRIDRIGFSTNSVDELLSGFKGGADPARKPRNKIKYRATDFVLHLKSISDTSSEFRNKTNGYP